MEDSYITGCESLLCDLGQLGDLLGLSFPGWAVRQAGLSDLWGTGWMGTAQSPGSSGSFPEDSRAPPKR